MTLINLLFPLTALLTGWFFYKALGQPLVPMLILFIWTGAQSLLASSGFFTHTDGFPPRMGLVLVPVLITLTVLLIHPGGKRFIQTLDIKWLTLLHIVRVPVEIGLFLLFREKLVPQLMTFEGRNFDILAGITAPLIFYLYFQKKILSNRMFLLWNFICLGLLLNILVNAILSIPGPLQHFAFDQPNIAVLEFPVMLLPALIVPLVMFSHLVVIARILRKQVANA